MRDLEKICLGCMREKPSVNGACPYCGFDAQTYEKDSRWLPPGYILNGKYLLGKMIGEGGFGITYIGWDLNLAVRVAIKEYFPIGLATRELGENSHYSLSSLRGEKRDSYKNGLKKFVEEAQSLSRFYHLNGIVAVKELFFENETAYMVMEYLDGVTLKEYLKKHGGRLSVEETLRIMEPVLRSLAEVHKAGLIHRDISTDNIMITREGKTKLIDFGSARTWDIGGNKTFTIVLKHGYAPPEQYQTKGKQGAWTDIYAASATIYRMITGQLPPNSMDRFGGDTLQSFAQLGCKVPDYVEEAVVKKGLALRAEQRYATVEELVAALYPSEQEKEKPLLFRKPAIAAGITAFVLLLLAAGVFMLQKNKTPAKQALLAEAGPEKSGQQTEKVTETESETATDALTESETETENVRAAETESETEPRTEAETAAAALTESETETESESGTQETESESETKAAETFTIDKTNFPDETFRAYVQENFDTDKDGVLSQTERDAAEEIAADTWTGEKIKSLKGVELFSNLKTLTCSNNELSELDVSRNTKLNYLSCDKNLLSELDVSKNTALESLSCYGNKLNELDVSQNAVLAYLDCENNHLSKLDVSRNAALEKLICDWNKLAELDVSQNKALEKLSCFNNSLSKLDVSRNTKLEELICAANELGELDVSTNPALTYLDCSQNRLSELDVSRNAKLEKLSCSGNRLSSLDVSGNPALTGLSTGLDDEQIIRETETARTAETERQTESETETETERETDAITERETETETATDAMTERETETETATDAMTERESETQATESESETKAAEAFAIDEENFPDETFRAYVQENFDTDKDGVLTQAERDAVGKIEVSNLEIQSMEGVELFTQLKELDCSSNKLWKLDVSQNTNLESMDCSENKLLRLDISSNTKLKALLCRDNWLSRLDVSNNPELTELQTGLANAQIEGRGTAEIERGTGAGIEQMRYSLSSLNIRALPDTETGEVIGRLYAGDPVMITGTVKGKTNGAEADWYEVRLADGTGYISASDSYTTDKPEEAPAGSIWQVTSSEPDKCTVVVSNRPLTSRDDTFYATVYRNTAAFCNFYNADGNMELKKVHVIIRNGDIISDDNEVFVEAYREFEDGCCSIEFILPETGIYKIEGEIETADGSIEQGWSSFEVLDR